MESGNWMPLVIPYKRDGELLQVKESALSAWTGKKVIMAEGDCEPCLLISDGRLWTLA